MENTLRNAMEAASAEGVARISDPTQLQQLIAKMDSLYGQEMDVYEAHELWFKEITLRLKILFRWQGLCWEHGERPCYNGNDQWVWMCPICYKNKMKAPTIEPDLPPAKEKIDVDCSSLYGRDTYY